MSNSAITITIMLITKSAWVLAYWMFNIIGSISNQLPIKTFEIFVGIVYIETQ